MADPKQNPIDPSKTLKARAAKCKRKKADGLVDSWAISVDYARGTPFGSESDADRVYVNVDNSMARRKAAQIASQLPEARLTAKNPRVAPILGKFAKRLNETARAANVGDAMFETAKDCINAAGFGVVLCGYESRTEMRKTLGVDPQTLSPEQMSGLEAAGQLDEAQAQELLKAYGIPIVEAPHVVSARFYARRRSPSDFLWPLEFERSNFDNAPWLGHSDKMTWAEAKSAFNLKDDEKEQACGGKSAAETNLRDDPDGENSEDDEIVTYDELFYWRALFDAEEKHFDCIWRVVFVNGLERVPVHGPWEGQKLLEGAGYIGATKLPLRVVTLDYISDDAIPPSDSAVARPQVNELIRSRTQMVQQRERSTPLRWHNVNQLDPLTGANLMRGTYQGSIPVKGNGNNVIGEVARANYPAENHEFDRIIKGDLQEAWQSDANQGGMYARGRRTAAEANNVQANFSTQIGFQRARFAAFVCGIFEVLAGLLALHGNDLPHPPEGGEDEQPMDVKQLSAAFDYSVLPDSTVLLDANQQADQYMGFLDMVGKSGFVNPETLIAKIAQLKGIDPAEVMIKPEGPKEEPPNLSYRFSGEDLRNPVALAMLIKAGQAPSPEELTAALKLLQAAGGVVVAPPGMSEPDPNAPPPEPGMPPADSRPEWTSMPTVSKRGDE